jgi:hypothetical protein
VSAGDTMQGRRIPDGEWFERRNAGSLKPGDYGREHITKASGTPDERTEWDWFVCCPDGSTTALWVNEDDRNGNRHVITEHDDGTISVGGSILGHFIPSQRIGGVGPISSGPWHGWLERGVWRSV